MTSVEKGVMDPLGYRAHANPESSDSKPSDCLKQETDKKESIYTIKHLLKVILLLLI